MKWLVLFLMTVLIVEGARAETATTGNLLPNAGTGQTSVQHSNSTIDGINSSTGFTLNNITDYSSSYNELEANGTGTVSATGTLSLVVDVFNRFLIFLKFFFILLSLVSK